MNQQYIKCLNIAFNVLVVKNIKGREKKSFTIIYLELLIIDEALKNAGLQNILEFVLIVFE